MNIDLYLDNTILVVGRLTQEREKMTMISEASEGFTQAIDRVSQLADRPLRRAFLARALNAIARLTPEITEEALGDAAGAASDYSVLLKALRTPEAASTLQNEQPLAAAWVRGLDARERLLLAEGGPLSVEQVARQLGLTRQAVDKRRRAGRLIALNTGRRGYAYPAWQFESVRVLAGIEAVLTDLAVRDGWMQTAFFLSGDPRLEGATPLDEIRRGNVDAVRRAAQGYGEHGAA